MRSPITLSTVLGQSDGQAASGSTGPATGGGGGPDGPRYEPYRWTDYGNTAKSTDQTTAFKSLISDAASTGQPIDLGKGNTITISPSSTINLSGIPAIVGDDVTVDCTGALNWDEGSNARNPVFKSDGSTRKAADDISANKGDSRIPLDAGLDLKRGDTILIASAEDSLTDDPEYRKGERKYVRRYNSGTGTCDVAEPLQFGYDPSVATNRVHIADEQELHIGKGITFVGKEGGEQACLRTNLCNTHISARFEHFGERALSIVKSRGRFNGHIYDTGFRGNPNTQYGIALGSFTDFHIDGAEIWAGKHAIKTGSQGFDNLAFAGGPSDTDASWTNRYTVTGGIYGNLPTEPGRAQGAIDAHAQCLSSVVVGAQVYGGLNVSSKYQRTADCEIHYGSESRGYYVRSDATNSGRKWGDYEVIDNTFVVEGGEVPPGFYFKIASVDFANDEITINRKLDMPNVCAGGDAVEVRLASDTKSVQKLTVATGGVSFDSSTNRTTITVQEDITSSDFSTGDFFVADSPHAPAINTSPDDGIRSIRVTGNIFRGNYGGYAHPILEIYKPTSEAVEISDNTFEVENLRQSAQIHAYADVVLTDNVLNGVEFDIQARAAGLDCDLSGNYSRDSFRRGFRVDTDSAGSNRWKRVRATGLSVRLAADRGVAIVDAQEVKIEASDITDNGISSGASSHQNLALQDVDELKLYATDLSSDQANTAEGLQVTYNLLSAVELSLMGVDARTGNSLEIDVPGSGVTWKERRAILSGSPETWTDNTIRATDLEIEDGSGTGGMLRGQTRKVQARDQSNPSDLADLEGRDTLIDRKAAFSDVNADPANNGEMQRNSADVKVYSGGEVRNLSDVVYASTPTTFEEEVTINDSRGLTVQDGSGSDRAIVEVVTGDGIFTLKDDNGNSWVSLTNSLSDFINSGALAVGQSSVGDATLDVDGALKVGSEVLPDAAGMIRWTGSDFEGYDGNSWISLT